MKKNKNIKYIVLAISALVSLIITPIIIALHYYFHEFGHLLFGYLSDIILFQHIPGSVHFVFKTMFYIPVPMRTEMDQVIGNSMISIGGPVFTVLWGALIVYFLFKVSPKNNNLRRIFLACLMLILAFYVIEAAANVLVGTDNWAMTPIFPLSEHPIVAEGLALMGILRFLVFAFVITFIVYDKIKNYRFFFPNAQAKTF